MHPKAHILVITQLTVRSDVFNNTGVRLYNAYMMFMRGIWIYVHIYSTIAIEIGAFLEHIVYICVLFAYFNSYIAWPGTHLKGKLEIKWCVYMLQCYLVLLVAYMNGASENFICSIYRYILLLMLYIIYNLLTHHGRDMICAMPTNAHYIIFIPKCE